MSTENDEEAVKQAAAAMENEMADAELNQIAGGMTTDIEDQTEVIDQSKIKPPFQAE